MFRRSRWQRNVTIAALVVGLWSGIADARAQSLGEVAAREAARRAAITTPSRVYTNMPRKPQDSATGTAKHAGPEVVEVASDTRERTAPAATASVRSTTALVQADLQKPVLPAPLSALPDRKRSAPRVHTSAGPAAPAPAASAAASSSARTSPAPALAGWSMFRIKKTQAELAESARLADVPRPTTRTGVGDVTLPRQRDTMRLSTGIGYLQGADWGGDVSGAGKVNGMQTDVNAFFTAGQMGFQWRSGRVSIFGPDGTWRGEGGDLYSDLRGLARGARVSWVNGHKWTPSVSLYLPARAGAPSAATVLAYRDRFQLLPRLRMGGEVTSDGAAFLQGQYSQPRLNLTAFYRFTRGAISGHDKGVSGAVDLGQGIAVTGAVRLSNAVGDSSNQWQLASFRLPLARQASVTIERSWWNASFDDGSTNALTLQLPVGKVRINHRLQWGRTDYRQRAVPFGFDRRQVQSAASYTPGTWGSVNYQQSTQWFEDGRVQEWDELTSMLQLGRQTTAQLGTAFPDIFDPRRFRARITQRLSPTLLFEAQYGRLSAFQMRRAFDGEQSRVMLTFRKTSQVESPARGGDVRGRAIDQLGSPVSGALVRLGPYSTITGDDGEYRFARVPNGRFELTLDKDKLPAAYAWDETPTPLTVTRHSRERIDLQVIPLTAIRGRVYLDRNRNGHFDEGEGIPNAVIAVNGSVTATSATGTYAFYNQAPGRYTIRLDVQRLPKGLVPKSPAALDVELAAHGPLRGIDFTLEPKAMPIIMREIPE